MKQKGILKLEVDQLQKDVSQWKENVSQLKENVSQLTEEKSEMTKIIQSFSYIIKLNVGGRIFETTKDTLVYYDYFNSMLSGKYPIEYGEDGSIFIDRDGDLFYYVLCYLREDSEYFEPPKDLFLRIKNEFAYFGIEFPTFEIKTCKNCRKPYNYRTSTCSYHPGEYINNTWNCCNQSKKNTNQNNFGSNTNNSTTDSQPCFSNFYHED